MLPLWLKIGYACFLMVLIPVYYKKYGPANFLWFSDIVLFGTALALWLENSLIVSIMAITAIIPELVWNVDYFVRLLTGKKLIGLSSYMFDPGKSLFLRSLSLFHVVLPAVMIYLLIRLGYDCRAIYYQPFLAWAVMLMVYFFTDRKENINMVFGPGEKPQNSLSPQLYLILLMLAYLLFLFLPTHFLLNWFFSTNF